MFLTLFRYLKSIGQPIVGRLKNGVNASDSQKTS
jgi:hypothetical protein